MIDLQPTSLRTPTFFIDESGSKSSQGKFFVIGLAKTYQPGRLSWELRHIKERYEVKGELKFSKVKNDTLPAYKAFIDAARATNTLLAAFVLDSRDEDGFGKRATWEAQADLTAQLIHKNLRADELGTVVSDIVTTPRGTSLAEGIKRRVNKRRSGLAIVSAIDMDSQAANELQVADLIAGAVNYERKARAGLTQAVLGSDAPKSQLVDYIHSTYGVASFDDCKGYLINVRTAKN
ncbi:MAG: DUF3800 domain-containing protein [Actinomycetaceae bacterium]|nr:DUF3800 domain-containing protein [Actinomycetaceae bacterium]